MTNTQAIQKLRTPARTWWHHAALREEGRVEEARKKELASTRSRCRDLRTTHLAGCARAGAWLDFDSGNVSGLEDDFLDVVAHFRPSVPRVDKRPIVEHPRFERWVTGSPMPRRGAAAPADGAAWSSMSYCPIGAYLAVWEHLGASVHWGELEVERQAWRRHPSVWATLARMGV